MTEMEINTAPRRARGKFASQTGIRATDVTFDATSFRRFAHDWFDFIMFRLDLNRREMRVAYYLKNKFNHNHGGKAWPTQRRIGAMLNVDPRTIRKALTTLWQAGLIAVTPGTQGRASHYEMTLPVRALEDLESWREADRLPDAELAARPHHHGDTGGPPGAHHHGDTGGPPDGDTGGPPDGDTGGPTHPLSNSTIYPPTENGTEQAVDNSQDPELCADGDSADCREREELDAVAAASPPPKGYLPPRAAELRRRLEEMGVDGLPLIEIMHAYRWSVWHGLEPQELFDRLDAELEENVEILDALLRVLEYLNDAAAVA